MKWHKSVINKVEEGKEAAGSNVGCGQFSTKFISYPFSTVSGQHAYKTQRLIRTWCMKAKQSASGKRLKEKIPWSISGLGSLIGSESWCRINEFRPGSNIPCEAHYGPSENQTAGYSIQRSNKIWHPPVSSDPGAASSEATSPGNVGIVEADYAQDQLRSIRVTFDSV